MNRRKSRAPQRYERRASKRAEIIHYAIGVVVLLALCAILFFEVLG